MQQMVIFQKLADRRCVDLPSQAMPREGVRGEHKFSCQVSTHKAVQKYVHKHYLLPKRHIQYESTIDLVTPMYFKLQGVQKEKANSKINYLTH